jgi:hypothetical protein
MVERVMVSATSQAGVDLNAVAASTWLSAPLQFVPGLGPRKAAALLRAVARAGGFVESRQQVWRDLGVFGNRVFRNAAPYLRIRASVKGAPPPRGGARALVLLCCAAGARGHASSCPCCALKVRPTPPRPDTTHPGLPGRHCRLSPAAARIQHSRVLTHVPHPQAHTCLSPPGFVHAYHPCPLLPPSPTQLSTPPPLPPPQAPPTLSWTLWMTRASTQPPTPGRCRWRRARWGQTTARQPPLSRTPLRGRRWGRRAAKGGMPGGPGVGLVMPAVPTGCLVCQAVQVAHQAPFNARVSLAAPPSHGVFLLFVCAGGGVSGPGLLRQAPAAAGGGGGGGGGAGGRPRGLWRRAATAHADRHPDGVCGALRRAAARAEAA